MFESAPLQKNPLRLLPLIRAEQCEHICYIKFRAGAGFRNSKEHIIEGPCWHYFKGWFPSKISGYHESSTNQPLIHDKSTINPPLTQHKSTIDPPPTHHESPPKRPGFPVQRPSLSQLATTPTAAGAAARQARSHGDTWRLGGCSGTVSWDR